MLGEHEGFTPLGDLGAEARDSLARTALPAMGRLNAGKDVSARRKMIAQALAQTADDDRYWIEAFASRLTGEGRLQAAEAEAVAFASAWAVVDKEMADQIRSVNTQGSDPFSVRVLNALTAAAPQFGKRMLADRIDSDEVMFSKDRRWNPRASARGGRRRDFFRFSFAGNSLYAGCCSKGSCSRCAVR